MLVPLLRKAGVMAACTVRITVAWWLRWYLAGVAMTAQMTGANPGYEKVRAAVMRGVKSAESDAKQH